MHAGPYNPPPAGATYGNLDSGASKRGCSCYKIYCCCSLCVFLVVAVIGGASLGIVVYMFSNLPKFSIDSIETKSFNFSDDGSLKTQLQATIKAENPTKHLEFAFGESEDPKDKSFEIFYSNVSISSGTLPAFTLPKKNTTMVNIDLNGEVTKDGFPNGSGDSLADKLKNNDNVPLLVVAHVPINKLKFWGTDMINGLRFIVKVNTTMNVKNLAQGKLEISDQKYYLAADFNKATYQLTDGKMKMV